MTFLPLALVIFLAMHVKYAHSYPGEHRHFPNADGASFKSFSGGVISRAFEGIQTISRPFTRRAVEKTEYAELASKLYYDPVSRRFKILDSENDRKIIASETRGRSSRVLGLWDSVVNFITDGFFTGDYNRTPKRKKKRVDRLDSEEYFDPLDSILDGLEDLLGGKRKKKAKRANELHDREPNKWNIPPPSKYESIEINIQDTDTSSTTPFTEEISDIIEQTEIESYDLETTTAVDYVNETFSTNLDIKKSSEISEVSTISTVTPFTTGLSTKYASKTTRKPVRKSPTVNIRRPMMTNHQAVYGQPSLVSSGTVVHVKECANKLPNRIPTPWTSRLTTLPSTTTTPAPAGWFDFFSADNPDDEAVVEPTEASSGGWFDSMFGVETTTKPPTTVPTTLSPETNWFDSMINLEEDDTPTPTKPPFVSVIPKERKGKRKSYKGFQLLRMYPDTAKKVEDLRDLQEDTQGSGLMWWSSPSVNRSADLMVPPGLLSDIKDHLKSEGMQYDVVIWDLQKAIQYENPKLSKTQRLELEKVKGHPMTWRRFHRYADILRYMEYLSFKYPEIVDLIPLGRTSEGLPIMAAKASVPPTKMHNTYAERKKWKLKSKMKPAIWIDGGMHAREWISPAVASWFLHTLVEGENGNGGDMELLKIADWYILPVGNPDGYEHTHTKDRFWRKTRSQHQNEESYFNSWYPWNWGNTECMGVDTNRNWDYHWGEKGSSNDPCSDFYAGPRPFSEPETMAVSSFLMENRDQFKAYLTLQSYAQMWVLPTTHSREQFSDTADLVEMGKLALNALSAVSGTKYQIGSLTDLVEQVTGTAHDWAKGRAGIKYSYAVKMRDSQGPYGFLLPGSQIIPAAKETWEAVKAIADNL